VRRPAGERPPAEEERGEHDERHDDEGDRRAPPGDQAQHDADDHRAGDHQRAGGEEPGRVAVDPRQCPGEQDADPEGRGRPRHLQQAGALDVARAPDPGEEEDGEQVHDQRGSRRAHGGCPSVGAPAAGAPDDGAADDGAPRAGAAAGRALDGPLRAARAHGPTVGSRAMSSAEDPATSAPTGAPTGAPGGPRPGPWGRDGGVRRVMGMETEFGISAPGEAQANPMLLSGRVVHAYASPSSSSPGRGTRSRRGTRWDYADEAPLRDARGYELDRARAHASQLTDAPPDVAAAGTGLHVAEELEDAGLANTVLTNGARLYVDHAHPEYSGPEVTTPRDAVLWDLAGDEVARESMRRIAASPGLGEVVLYKNNTDGKGSSYGTHENYLMPRSTPFADIVRALVPFFVSRQVVTGAGRVGRGQTGERSGFQLSQRADFFETEVGLETTLKRPLVNTRDEPHATAESWRRLHVIVGDANLCQVANLLKVGTTSLVLAMVEAGEAPDLALEQPVAAVRAVSHDPSLAHLLTLRTGERLTAVQLQWRHLEAARAFVERRQGSAVDADTAEVLELWEQVLTDLEADPMRCARQLDWVAKLRLLEGFRTREDLTWDAARLALIDIQYADLRPERGLHARLVARGAVDLLHEPAAVARAVGEPPEDTRAWFRGECVRRYGDDVAAASWDSVILDVAGRTSLQRVPMLEPLRGTRASVGALLDRCPTAAELVRALTGGRPAG